MSKKTVGDMVLDLFPYLRDVEKQQIMDHVYPAGDDDADIMDDASYPQARLLVHFLQKRIRAKAEEVLGQQMQEAALYEADLEAEKKYDQCMYCPYSTACPRAEHDRYKEA